MGTFAFMAPELVRGSVEVDPRADVYAVGAVVFHALTGRLPFEGSSALALIAAKLDRDAPPLEGAPADVGAFVAAAMARDREGRFPTATEALAAWSAP